MRDERGFTLTEMIITLAVLGILLAIAAMSGNDMLVRYKVENQTRQIFSDLMNARAGAMQRNRIFFVTLAANQYAIYEDTYSAATNTTTPDGDGSPQLGPGQDKSVMQKTTQYALASSPTVTIFQFNATGLASFGTFTGVNIRCQSTTVPAYDCIEIKFTRVLMGKWNGTTTCVTK